MHLSVSQYFRTYIFYSMQPEDLSILKEIKKKKACKKKHIPNFNVILQVQDSYLVFDKLQNSILIICNINVSFALAKRFENGLKRRWLYPQLHVFIDDRFRITSSNAICACAVTVCSQKNQYEY